MVCTNDLLMNLQLEILFSRKMFIGAGDQPYYRTATLAGLFSGIQFEYNCGKYSHKLREHFNMSDRTEHVGSPPPSLMNALKRLLRPLVKLLITYGINYTTFCELLKRLYVETATNDFVIEGRKQTVSRVSLLTGVHRKDVKRLQNYDEEKYVVPKNISLGGQLVAKWTSLAEYQDHNGQPIPLPRLIKDGGDLSFEALAISVSKDIRSRVILDEWLRLGIAHLDNNDQVILNTNAFVPETGFDEKAFFFGQNLHDHIAAGVFNMSGNTPAFLERSVYYNRLTADTVGELNSLAKSKGMALLQELNRKAIGLTEKRTNQENENHRMNFGIYFYTEPCTPDRDG